MNGTATSGFYKLSLITLVAVYFLVLVGGIVRSTGSGMGCPDWPRCFGRWVPPTDESQLPPDYKEKFAAFRDKKNQKFARYLSAFGFEATANSILTDKSILEEADFNPAKTWIEYVNRVVGVITGILIIGVFIRGFRLRKQKLSFFSMSLAALILVIIQGWFGSIVVSTNLTSWTITVHMLLAFVLVAMLVWLVVKSGVAVEYRVQASIRWTLVACILLLTIQVILGTEVRSAIDRVVAQLPRESWISGAGTAFIIHRSFSWVVLIFHAILGYQILKTIGLNPLTLGLIVLILLTILTGAGLAYFAVPAFLQPVHLLVATIAFGLQIHLLLVLKKKAVAITT